LPPRREPRRPIPLEMLMQHSASLTLLLKYLDLRTPPRMLGCSPAAIGRRGSRRPTATVRVRSPAPAMSGEIHSLRLPAHFWGWGSTVLAAVLVPVVLVGVGGPPRALTSVVTFHPAVSDFQFITASETPPTQAQCASVGRRCFNATAMQNSYNLGPLYGHGFDGRG